MYKLSSINCMNELEKRLKEYKSAAMEFKRVLERREESITECKQEIQLFLESFPAVIEEMQQRFAKEGKVWSGYATENTESAPHSQLLEQLLELELVQHT